MNRNRHALGVSVVVALAVAACAHVEPNTPAGPLPLPEPIATPDPEPAGEKPRCKKADADWLRTQAPAEGSIVIVFEVSKDRREQIEQLNSQLAKIAAALERGCLEQP